MRTMSIREVRDALPKLDSLIASEGEVIITRRGRPIAKFVPLQGDKGMPSYADLRAMVKPLKRPSAELIREDRERL
ncbi:MAG: type II toxin-antitoxin system Phd/YefM family antitoxin [Truepera sp.]|nr:type II toxin-antitoxin system Phd/YefM family antitoxin [Truepera sp.]